ncbi:LAMI_0E12706g1_1 [Lachancea mirantina]|uniref:Protein arginine methyltransferase NDUFAF7 n=1 Tax=Lachancea mirantina TaxID=1230905 RepID=A0A1G4JQ82_9SACH|nr:LAMI_0E12706g1_1 [Lachancea mirantina]
MRSFQKLILRRKHTFPLWTTHDLLRSGLPARGSEATIPYRDFIEWVGIENQKSQNFFASQMSLRARHSLPTTAPFQQLLSHCIARWLLVDYKLNYYPYYNLNVVLLHTDFHRSLSIARTLLEYFRSTISPGLFDRVTVFLVPLHDDSRRKLIPDTKIKIVDHSLFSTEPDFLVDDPAHILMVDDIMRNLSQDLIVRRGNEWHQGFVDIATDGSRNMRLEMDMDYWCNKTFRLLEGHLNGAAGDEAFIPTKLVQLLHILKLCVPDHRLLAIDYCATYRPSLVDRLKGLCGYKMQDYHMSQRIGPVNPLHSWEPSSFLCDFNLVKQLYASVNEGMKTCRNDPLETFVESWSDLDESKKSMDWNEVLSQSESLGQSPLSVLHG